MNIDELQIKYKQLTIREKALALLSIIVLIVFTSVNFIISPMYDDFIALKKDEKSTKKLINTINSNIQSLDNKLDADPVAAIEREFKNLNIQHNQKIKALEKLKLALVSSDEMASLVEEVVDENKKLTLMSLTSKTPEVLLSQLVEGNEQVLLYKHAIDIKLKGQYFALLAFMKKIEEKEHSISWSDIDYRVSKYPNAIMSFEIYTISTDKEFIGVK